MTNAYYRLLTCLILISFKYAAEITLVPVVDNNSCERHTNAVITLV